MNARTAITHVLAVADVSLDGKRPQDITVNNPDFFKQVLSEGELALGEAYMNGDFDANQLDVFIEHLLAANLDQNVKPTLGLAKAMVSAKVTNLQSVSRAKRDVSYHYNIGNDLYEKMLDDRMIYTCGYWARAKNLNQAQEHKLDLICQKLYLKKGMTILDIGCGWGGFAEYATKKFGVKVTGISLSEEQIKIAKRRTKGLGAKMILKDYRDMTGKFDRIVSIGMLEHVGLKNYSEFFEICNRLLAPGGIMLHHSIGNNHRDTGKGSRWIRKYIFPGTQLPTLSDFDKAVEWKFVIEDVHNFGPDYDKTLLAWHRNFIKSYPKLDHTRYDERFKRMWEYYLLSVAATFRTRKIQLWQIVMRRDEAAGTYRAVR